MKRRGERMKPTDLPTQDIWNVSAQHHTQHSTAHMTPTAVSLHLSTFLTLTAAKQQPKLTHACTTPGAQHCNCRCLSLMSVIAVGNQIDCTHRPSKYLYSHIQQTSARVPKCYKSTERGNRSDVMNIILYML